MAERSDTELVEQARIGDMESLGELYRRHYPAAVGIAYARGSDRHLAEDAAQEAFAVVCRDLGRLRRPDRFVSWLGAICRRLATRAAKARPRHRLPDEANLPAATGNPGDDRRDVVRQAVRRLPLRAREVIVLRYFNGLSHEQIASTLGISPQAVHGRLIRARRRIAQDLRRNGLERQEQ